VSSRQPNIDDFYQPDNLFAPDGTVTPGTGDALSKILQHTPEVYCIIVTNFIEIAVFTPPREERPGYTFERPKTTHFTLTLRAISAASLFDLLPRTFIHHPDIDTISIIHEGPPQNPDEPLPSDQEVFDSCKRLADFDLITILRYPAWARQFFRWCQYAKEHKTSITRPGEILTAVTNDTGTLFPKDARPLFPFDLSELPVDTSTHLKTIQRESPLAVANIGQCLEESRNFTIEILKTISENSADGMSSVYLCQITSIDDQSVSSPTLCLKLFDDRFQQIPIPEDELDYADYFANLDNAPSLALNEAQIYDKLRPVQGTIVPWFYGIHQVGRPILRGPLAMTRADRRLTVYASQRFNLAWPRYGIHPRIATRLGTRPDREPRETDPYGMHTTHFFIFFFSPHYGCRSKVAVTDVVCLI
jgi:hypothetical protein